MRGMSLAPAAPLQDLGPLILGDHPLDLEQQVILRRLAQRAVEEHDLDAGTPELVDELHMFMNPTGISINPATCAGLVQGCRCCPRGRGSIGSLPLPDHLV